MHPHSSLFARLATGLCGLTLALWLGGCDSPAESSARAAETPRKVAPQAAIEGAQPAVEAVAEAAKPEPKVDEVTAFDLVDNRHLAHLWDGGLVMDLGDASALKYAQGRWNTTWYGARKHGETQGAFYTHPRGVSGTLRMPIAAPAGDADAWQLSVRLKPVGSQRCDLFLSSAEGEEAKFASLNAIEDGWATYSVDLPKSVEPGREYTLRMHFSRSREISGGRSAAAIDWVRIGPKVEEPAEAVARRSAVFDVPTRTIRLQPGQALDWYLTPAEAAELVAEVVEGEARVRITPDGEDETVFSSKDGVLRARVPSSQDTPVRLTFMPAGDADVALKSPRLVVPRGPQIARAGGPKYVIVYIIDTLRADHLRLYNPSTDVKTPNLDAFAKEAALFTNATAQGNSSLPTSASIFTSAYTVVHGLTREGAKLLPEHEVFAEPFDAAGWRTGLFSGNGYVSKGWGFASGFDTEVNPIREGRPSDGEYLWPEAKAWLASQVEASRDEPVLLYINVNDPHVPYDAPDEDLRHYWSGARVGSISPRGTGQLLHDIAGGSRTLNRQEADYLHALYKAEITYSDRWFGKMLADLDALGIRDEAMILVTADHGEEFGEYGRWGHGISVNEELVGVPLIVGYRPWTRPGHKIDQAAEVIDLLPTAADAAGLRLSGENVQGASLVDLILDHTPRHRAPGFSYHNDFLRGARIGGWKYQLFNGDNERLYRVEEASTGGAARKDLTATHPIARRMMRDVMAFQVGLDREWKKSHHGYVNNHSPEAAAWLDARGW